MPAQPSSLTASFALLLIRWIHPPGAASLPISALLFSVLRTFVKTGGTGDPRGFQNLFLASLCLPAYAAILILVTPFMASYLTISLTLFGGLFVFGFLTARIPGFTFWTMLSILSTSIFVGLNPQVPVASSNIINSILGTISGIAIATVIGRLIWPVLPQRLLRDDLVKFLRQLSLLAKPDRSMEKIQTQLTLLPIEAFQASRKIRLPGFGEEERRQFELLIRQLSLLAARRTALLVRRLKLPANLNALVHPDFERLEVEFGQITDAFADCFRKGDCQRDFPTLGGAVNAMRERADQLRRDRALAAESVDAPMQLLELVSRYQTVEKGLQECASLIRSMKLHRYWGDYAL